MKNMMDFYHDFPATDDNDHSKDSPDKKKIFSGFYPEVQKEIPLV